MLPRIVLHIFPTTPAAQMALRQDLEAVFHMGAGFTHHTPAQRFAFNENGELHVYRAAQLEAVQHVCMGANVALVAVHNVNHWLYDRAVGAAALD